MRNKPLRTYYLLVAGPRVYKDYEEFHRIMNQVCTAIYYQFGDRIVIVEGGAIGVDGMARQYALDHQMKVVEMRADWRGLGKSAGIIRNRQMNYYIAKQCEADPENNKRMTLLFWNGTSKGTASNIDLAYQCNNPTCVIFIKTGPDSRIIDFKDKDPTMFYHVNCWNRSIISYTIHNAVKLSLQNTKSYNKLQLSKA